MVSDEVLGLGLFLAIAALALGVGWVVLGSIHQPIQAGQYTGQVIEVEYETGFVAQTSTVYLKTDPTSSKFESLCILNAPSNPQTDVLREYSQNQTRITAHYKTPLWVPVWDCSTTPVLTEVEGPS